MSIPVVENVNGQVRIRWKGAGILALGVFAATGVMPALGFLLVFGPSPLVLTQLVFGMFVTAISTPLLIQQQLRLPIERLPRRACASAMFGVSASESAWPV